ncbi:MAG TPA: thiamine diphosphokinase [Halanaerobiales bacterium]|nr:thiamine diphosphokinase [Halanaerobiales bacterium]
MKEAILALNGSLHNNCDKYNSILSNKEIIIAADGGANLLSQLNICPDLIIGDMDSLTKEKLNNYRKKGVKTIKYPVKKEKTDGELAIDYCLKNSYDKVFIIGSTGGRIDQQLANIFLLEYASRLGLNAVIKEPGLEIGIITDKKNIKNKAKNKLSLLPISEVVSGINISGCKYLLNDATLYRFKTRGISNEISSHKAVISIKNGILLYIINSVE